MVDNDGNELVEQEQDDGQFKWRIQKTWPADWEYPC